MKRLDVVTTALCRPELLALTYRSFFGPAGLADLPSLRIIINIDPLGDADPYKCVEVACKYSNDVVYRVSKVPNFAVAVNWCVDNILADHVLWLEDDWLLTRQIAYPALLDYLQKSMAHQVLLPMKRLRDRNLKYSFRPHLGKTSVIKNVSPVPSDYNPEKWFSNYLGGECSTDFPKEYMIKDLGRKWAKSQGLKKGTSIDGPWFLRREQTCLRRIEFFLYRVKAKAHLFMRELF